MTRFHAEGGGQVGDTGYLEGPWVKCEITAVKKLLNGATYHIGNVTEGLLKISDTVN